MKKIVKKVAAVITSEHTQKKVTMYMWGFFSVVGFITAFFNPIHLLLSAISGLLCFISYKEL